MLCIKFFSPCGAMPSLALATYRYYFPHTENELSADSFIPSNSTKFMTVFLFKITFCCIVLYNTFSLTVNYLTVYEHSYYTKNDLYLLNSFYRFRMTFFFFLLFFAFFFVCFVFAVCVFPKHITNKT